MRPLIIPLIAQVVEAVYSRDATPTRAVSLADGATCACAQLSNAYANLTLFGNSTNYVAEATNYWDIRSDLLPKSQFAMRGRGHMNFPGSNNIDGGVLLALNGLNELRISDDNSTIEVGPGNRWVDVYTALAPRGLYAIGGRLKTIGVAGLELIGGFHYFINKYGMAMDNVISYDVILGNGTQLTANSTSNPDLFWALKGGANNFALVTKFTLKVYPIPLISTTTQLFGEATIPDFITATVDFATHDEPDVAAGAVINVSYNSSTQEFGATLLGVQESTVSPPSRFANFSALPSTLRQDAVVPPIEWHNSLDSPNQMFRVQFAHKTIKADANQLQRIFEDWKSNIVNLNNVKGLYSTWVMNILPKSALSVAKNNGVGNVWGLDDDETYILWQFANTWEDAEDDLRVTNFARSFVDYWHEDSKARGLASEFLYMGDAGEFQNPFSGFPLENVNKMKDIRSSYDPLGVFTSLNWGGFKLAA
ncbi:FAD-binding domain-containing protein [Diaporthe amygdali]|uniref:FAD-binding domain-containing protein n=1 Tax=Phomopsis amygdali TaxID=1214568 RepID=UPI0022FF2C80|nr:FAD-binding domain-containing protein [Diaporthe amygdali]KAJ0103722.1 FAD-binding domain-containing protein [Diaporthe amygdali]